MGKPNSSFKIAGYRRLEALSVLTVSYHILSSMGRSGTGARARNQTSNSASLRAGRRLSASQQVIPTALP